jgi:hypothetical protein
MNFNILTTLIMILVTAGLILWDVFVVSHGWTTISNHIMNASREFMTVAACWGVLMGHFFGWWLRPVPDTVGKALALATYGALLLGWDFWMQYHPYPDGSPLHWLRYPLLWALVSVPIGMVLFPQHSDFNFEYLRGR